jgi:uncharacterized membrane protein
MNIYRKLAIVVILIAGFIFTVSFATLYAQTNIIEGTACSCTLPIPVLIPTFSSLGIFIGSVVYYFISPKITETDRKFAEGTRIMLDMLQLDERNILNKLINNKGEITQSKLSSEFGKVRTFRIIENLKKRGIIQKEQYGKTNKIVLTEKFKNILV